MRRQEIAAGRRRQFGGPGGLLAGKAAKVWLLVRGPGLEATMSRYLIDRIAALANVEVVTQAEVTGLGGHDGVLEQLRWRRDGAGRASKIVLA